MCISHQFYLSSGITGQSYYWTYVYLSPAPLFLTKWFLNFRYLRSVMHAALELWSKGKWTRLLILVNSLIVTKIECLASDILLRPTLGTASELPLTSIVMLTFAEIFYFYCKIFSSLLKVDAKLHSTLPSFQVKIILSETHTLNRKRCALDVIEKHKPTKCLSYLAVSRKWLAMCFLLFAGANQIALIPQTAGTASFSHRIAQLELSSSTRETLIDVKLCTLPEMLHYKIAACSNLLLFSWHYHYRISLLLH